MTRCWIFITLLKEDIIDYGITLDSLKSLFGF